MASLLTSPPTSKIFYGYVQAFLLIATGIHHMADPAGLSQNIIPVPANTPATSYVSMMGARNLAIGLISAVLTYRGDINALAVIAYFLAVPGLVDGWYSYRAVGIKQAWSHWFVSALLPIAAWWLES